jgi:NAD(P)-dependent dehydrogenase (short-subunit alcohol dehydrogenase family)
VELFIAEGARVMIAARNTRKGEEMVAVLGDAAGFVQTDVSHEPEIARAVTATVAAFGRLDCLFNNAGGPTVGLVDTVTPEDFRHAMDMLLGSVVFGIRHAAPVMKAQGRGAIINNGSVAAGHAHLGDYLYSIAKAGLNHTTRLAGMELARHGITVNSISPGAIATPICFGGSSAAATLEPAHAEAKLVKLAGNLAKATPLRRSGMPADIAAAALFLASDDGAFVNCHDLVVDGGMTAGGRTSYES